MKKSIIIFLFRDLFSRDVPSTWMLIKTLTSQRRLPLPLYSPQPLQGSANNLSTDYLSLTRWTCFWSRSGNYVPDVQTETYDIPNNYTDAEWTKIYQTLNSYNYIGTIAGNNTSFL
jgi:hypothetical protein